MLHRLPGALGLIIALALPSLGSVGAPATAAAAPAPPRASLHLVLPLRADRAGLAAFAQAVSTPGSALYGHFQPVALLARRFGASPAVRAHAVAFLRRTGARRIIVSPTGLAVAADLTVAAAERAFATRLVRVGGRLGRFIAPAAGARAASVAVPRALRGVITGVIGLDTRPVLPHRALARAHAAASPQASSAYEPAGGTPSGCAAGVHTGGFTPDQYVTAYGYGPLQKAGLRGQGVRVALIEEDGFKPSDLTTFARCFGLGLPRIATYTIGAGRTLPAGGEATLDLEVLAAAAPALSGIDVYESNGDAAQVTDAFAAPLLNPGVKPQVISASLGLCEPDFLRSFGEAGKEQVESDLELAASTGITLLASSGDSGSSACLDQTGYPVAELAVNFPASSPVITAVGGTNLTLDAGNAITDQPVWNDAGVQPAAGGGGPSAMFPTAPAYQRDVSPRGPRLLPDVSMLADISPGYAIFCTAPDTGCTGWITVGGTSAAAPLLAGGMALVDQDLHRHGRELLGPINPLLYAIGASSAARARVFSDVTGINNDLGPFLKSGDGTELGCCTAGPGYDQASGWGSVDLEQFARTAVAVLPRFAEIRLLPLPRQSPVRAGRLTARIGCAGACRAGVLGFVSVGHFGGFNVGPRAVRLAQGGVRTITLRFTPAQERLLRAALAQHVRLDAELFGIALDGAGRVATFTSGRILRIAR